jgi:hypothetical protein
VLDADHLDVPGKPDQAARRALEMDRMILLGHEITLAGAWSWGKALALRAWVGIRHRTQRIRDLKARVDALEAALARCPAEGCRGCGERQMRAVQSVPHPRNDTVRMLTYRCGACGFEDVFTRLPGQQIEF